MRKSFWGRRSTNRLAIRRRGAPMGGMLRLKRDQQRQPEGPAQKRRAIHTLVSEGCAEDSLHLSSQSLQALGDPTGKKQKASWQCGTKETGATQTEASKAPSRSESSSMASRYCLLCAHRRMVAGSTTRLEVTRANVSGSQSNISKAWRTTPRSWLVVLFAPRICARSFAAKCSSTSLKKENSLLSAHLGIRNSAI